ncbi:uncharacterized protein LOC130664235 [Microplitis mediator]|uniref:uncharacterized protein LOC130664235 n=1 Tax=Microplitis mediator TaxID=375433 RepID=UPI002557C260|nr:uncharacterized protein LOC130664235 [Microplitis mediator]
MYRESYSEISKIMYTPHSSARQKIRQQFNLIPLAAIDTDENDERSNVLQDLIKKTWYMWSVSTLFNFTWDNERVLKLYAKRLREEIASILPHHDVAYEAKVTAEENNTTKSNETDPPAIKIELFARKLTEEVPNCIYTGLITSWGSTINDSENEKSANLPLLLCRGNKTAIRAVNKTLNVMFDCTIIPLLATEEDLQWLLPAILQHNKNNPTKGQVKLEYKLLNTLITDSIGFTCDVSTLSDLWNAICDSSDDNDNDSEVLLKPVQLFHEVLLRQTLVGAGLQLGLSKLFRMTFPTFKIMDNKIYAKTTDDLHKILLYFNEKAFQILYTNLDSVTNSSSELT